MYYDILLPTDGSSAANNAAKKAFELAEQCRAEIHVLHVIDVFVQSYSPQVAEQAEQMQREKGRKAINKLVQEAEKRNLKTSEHTVKSYNAGEAICEFAGDQDIDVIVMGTHGKSGLNRMLLGSTTERVLRTSKVPVLAVPTAEQTSNSHE